MSASSQRIAARFLRRLVVAMVLFFGLGTVLTNGLPLLATPEARAELGDIPYALFWFDFLVGWLYLGQGVAVALRRRGAMPFAWALAVLHSFSATAVWLWFFAGHPVEHGTLGMVLMREGFWVCIGLYLWRAGTSG